MSAVIVIPARYASQRFPGKPLAELRGASGVAKSLIRRSWDAAMAVNGVDRVIVATDDDRIAEAAEAFGAEVAMTSTAARNGTERVAEVARGLTADVIVNLQGDAPLTPPHYVEALLAEMARDGEVRMATPVLETPPEHLAALIEDRRAGRVGATTAVIARSGDALYFSKEVLPHQDGATGAVPVWHHVGVYAYRPDALAAYSDLPQGPLETREGLEQLRFLENGWPVRCVPVEARGRAFWELNNPSDIPRIEDIMTREGIE